MYCAISIFSPPRSPSPNSLWHIDGYHKLIWWRLVIHGGIDGYNRIPVYLKVASNNKAETVFDAFCAAVTKFGLPSRVCANTILPTMETSS